MRLFEFHQPVFEKVVSAGLSSLGLKGYHILVKNWIFDDPLHKKRIVLVICVLGMIQRWGRVNFLMNWGCWGHWGHWGCWGCRGHWGCKGSKAWKITFWGLQSHPCSCVLLYFDFLKIYWFVGFMKYRGSPLSTNSLSTIPEVVRFINSTKSVNSPK